MACVKPITVGQSGSLIQTRCRQCLPCRIFEQSCLTFQALLENHHTLSGQFLTLTYRQAPEVGSWQDFSLFMKRLRSRNARQGNRLPIRFLGCGEYGERSGRFHYHGLIFNSLTFDREVWDTALWPHGFVHIGEVTPSSARYTVRYTLKGQKTGGFVAGKSERPPLGAPLMRSLAESWISSGRISDEPPTTMRWDGRVYPLSSALKIAWCEVALPHLVLRNAAGTKVLAKSIAQAKEKRIETLVCGDELEDYRLRSERRAISLERNRHGKL